MTFRERASVALKAAVGLFDETSLRQTHDMLARIYPAQRGDPPVRGTVDRLKAYRDMPWLRACAERVAESLAATEWQLFVQRKDGKPIKNRMLQRASRPERIKLMKALQLRGELEQIERHVLLDDVLDRGNSYLTGHATRKVTQLHLDLAGEAFWLKERDGFGTVIGVWPLPAHWVIATPTPSYRFYRVQFRGWNQDIPDTEMLWMANVDPANPYGRGTGITGALADDLEIDEYARRQTKMTFYNGAQPPFIVYPKGKGTEPGQWGEPETRRAEQKWLNEHQGFWKKAKPMFSTRELGIHEFSQDMQLQATPIRDQERDTILHVWGYPPEMFGITESSNRATSDVAGYIYEKYLVESRREFMRTQMQERLLPEYDDRLILGYVSTVPEDKEYALKVAQAAPWTLTLNQWLEMQGQPQIDGPQGELRMVPFNLTPARSLDELAPTVVTPPDTGTPDVPTPDNEEGDGATTIN